jgi:YfiH family protein
MSRTLFTSRHGGDLKNSENRESLRDFLSLENLVFMNQSHSDVIIKTDDGIGEYEADALITMTKGVGLAVMVADCLPVLLSSSTAVAAVHAGRIGMSNQIVIKTVQKMMALGCRDIVAVVGPSICADCYEVSEEMYSEIIAQIPASATTPQRHALDLRSGVSSQLESIGVSVSHVRVCTRESGNHFSFRRGGEMARQAGVISL